MCPYQPAWQALLDTATPPRGLDGHPFDGQGWPTRGERGKGTFQRVDEMLNTALNSFTPVPLPHGLAPVKPVKSISRRLHLPLQCVSRGGEGRTRVTEA